MGLNQNPQAPFHQPWVMLQNHSPSWECSVPAWCTAQGAGRGQGSSWSWAVLAPWGCRALLPIPCCWRANVCLGADAAIRKQLQNYCADPNSSQPLLLDGAAAQGRGCCQPGVSGVSVSPASPGYCGSPQLLILPDCALVLVGLSVFAASTLEHPHGLAFPQLWLCLILVYLKFLLLPPPFCLLAVNFFIDTSFRNCLHLRAANSLLPTSPGFNLYNMFIFTAIFSFYSKPR